MSVTTVDGRRAGIASRRRSGIASPLYYRLQRWLVEGMCLLLGAALFIWSIAPIYNMWEIALDSHDDIFAGNLWPDHPTTESFRVVFTQDFWYLAPVR